MRLIDNLEELKVGDFISTTTYQREKIIYKITDLEDEAILLEVMVQHKYSWSGDKFYELFPESRLKIIGKTVKKIKKRKLRHKAVTYNEDLTIFLLNEKEKRDVIRKKILANLEK